MRGFALAFGLLGPAWANGAALEADPWTRADTLWELSYVALVAMDCAQSSQIQRLNRVERNPLLPRRPSPGTVRLICLGSVAGHAAVSHWLPSKWRRRFQVGTAFLEAGVVADNYFRAGIRIQF